MTGKRIDFHCHTRCSDGTLSPRELVALAVERNVGWLAITDHDTCAAWPEANDAAREAGITLIGGIECSSQWERREVHIVGLGIAPANPTLRAFEEAQRTRRTARAVAICERLHARGIALSIDELPRDSIPGRVVIAQALVAGGWVSDVDAAFKRYLADNKPAYVRTAWPTMQEAIDVIHAAGGCAVLAHPVKYRLTRRRLECLIQAFQAAGGDGIELRSGPQDIQDTYFLARMAERYALRVSLGSDFHSPALRWQQLGVEVDVPSSCQPVWEALNVVVSSDSSA